LLVSKSNELGNVGHPRLVLIQNNKVIGGIFVDNDYLPYEYMFDIFIKNSKRGKGYSKLLLDAMIKDFVENFMKNHDRFVSKNNFAVVYGKGPIENNYTEEEVVKNLQEIWKKHHYKE
jgi:hypothetical protein